MSATKLVCLLWMIHITSNYAVILLKLISKNPINMSPKNAENADELTELDWIKFQIRFGDVNPTVRESLRSLV